jgi:hypothetical protein
MALNWYHKHLTLISLPDFTFNNSEIKLFELFKNLSLHKILLLGKQTVLQLAVPFQKNYSDKKKGLSK